jgi:predicted Zn finger-like uncharacterized protein
VIITCPGCKTRYRVDAKALKTPGGRTVRCAACGLSWHHPPTAVETGAREPAKAKPPLEAMLVAPPQPEPPDATPVAPAAASARPWATLLAAEQTGGGGPIQEAPAETQPRRRRWLMVGLPMLVVVIVLLAALYLYRP